MRILVAAEFIMLSVLGSPTLPNPLPPYRARNQHPLAKAPTELLVQLIPFNELNKQLLRLSKKVKVMMFNDTSKTPDYSGKISVWISILCLAAFNSLQIHAARVLPGKYSGMVVFDRWDNCYLLVNHFQLYISDSQKESLRKYAGKGAEILATDVYQPSSTRPARVNSFQYLGPASKGRHPRGSSNLRDLNLSTHMDFTENGHNIFFITAHNQASTPLTLFSNELGLTLLRKKELPTQGSPSDGESFVLLSGHSFEFPGERIPRISGAGMTYGINYKWHMEAAHALPHSFELAPYETRTLKLTFDLPDGHYDFLSCYGSFASTERCVASNLTSFDIKDGNCRNDRIQGAFGYRLGARFDVSDAKLVVNQENGLHEYRIQPFVHLQGADIYSLKITPKTMRIFQIQAISRCKTTIETKQRLRDWTKLLEQKYGLLELILTPGRHTGFPMGRLDGTRHTALIEHPPGQTVIILVEDQRLHVEAKQEALSLKRND